MPALTDTAIRHALKRVEISRKQENLADGEGRGTGRLVLVLKPMPKRVTADWMAQQWRDGKRTKKKIGAYPSMSLAQAREVFKRDYADVIQKGRSIKIASDTRPGTVAGQAFAAAVYGNHPYGQRPTEATLARIQLADMQQFHARHVDACRARVHIVGAVQRAQARLLVAALLAGLARGFSGFGGALIFVPIASAALAHFGLGTAA